MSSKLTDGAATATTKKTDAAPADYTGAGTIFTGWFNDKVYRLTNPTIQLGTKTATVVKLHPDGRLECALHGEGGSEAQHFVAFEPQYLDQLLPRFAVPG